MGSINRLGYEATFHILESLLTSECLQSRFIVGRTKRQIKISLPFAGLGRELPKALLMG